MTSTPSSVSISQRALGIYHNSTVVNYDHPNGLDDINLVYQYLMAASTGWYVIQPGTSFTGFLKHVDGHEIWCYNPPLIELFLWHQDGYECHQLNIADPSCFSQIRSLLRSKVSNHHGRDYHRAGN